jgi:N-acyl-D-aspartate/D-glutamate deacylase
MAYDLVVRNGTVIDGSGAPAYRADVGVIGDTIAAIGRIRERGADEVDAEGHIVAPGFIDGHTHMDAQICWDPLGTCSSWHGVSTVVMGNCGFTVAPCRSSEKYLAIRSLERAEDISGAAMEAGIDWRWETFSQYFDVVEALPKGINYSGYIGHSALRSYVMGERSFEQAGSDDDLVAMQAELRSALHAGAIGFSTSRSHNHATSDDKPVASRLASWDEVRMLVNTMGEMGTGVFELAQEHYTDAEPRREYYQRLQALTIESGRPTTFVVGAAGPDSSVWRQMIGVVEDTVAKGGRMFAQVHARQFMSIMGFKVGLPFDRLPTWQSMRSQPLDQQRAALLDPTVRRALVDEAMHGPYRDGIGSEARPPVWDMMFLAETDLPPYRSVAQVAAEQNTTPVDVIIELSLAHDFELYFMQPFANHDLDAVLELMRHPSTVIAVSDSGAHVSQIIDASIPTHLLAYWTRQQGAFTWEQAVRMLTFDPARLWGFSDRGLVREGFRADLAVFDPQRVSPGLPTSAVDLPGGAKRLKQKATGMLALVVNGSVLMRNNEHTGALPGRLLRGPLAARRAVS